MLGEVLTRLGYIQQDSLHSTLRMQGGTAPTPAGPAMLGQLLLRAGIINGTQLEDALKQQKQSGKLLGAVLEEMGCISNETTQAFLQRQSAERAGVSCPATPA